ncbi:hypothetical protein M8J76_002237 [Diaphorina citri]|nr:hypothetical protein M8J75_009186 [Diaphorina citri]KAI5713613.1 hypothetical protein M8J76_002237 [Diaphorina citri]
MQGFKAGGFLLDFDPLRAWYAAVSPSQRVQCLWPSHRVLTQQSAGAYRLRVHRSGAALRARDSQRAASRAVWRAGAAVCARARSGQAGSELPRTPRKRV